MDDEEQILPQIVLFFDVVNESFFWVFVNILSLETANKADVPHIIFHRIFLFSQLTESVNDDTENDIEEHDNNDQEKWQIVSCAKIVVILVSIEIWIWREGVTNTSACP